MRRLGYYVNEFPLPQGMSAGPYREFVGTPIQQEPTSHHAHVPCVILQSPTLPSRKRHGLPSNVLPSRKRHGGCACHSQHGCRCSPWHVHPGRGKELSTVRSRHRHGGNIHGLGDDTTSVFMPAGTALTYSFSWNSGGLLGNVAAVPVSSSQVCAYLQTSLPSLGVAVDNASPIGAFSVGNGGTLSIHTTADFGQAADVKSIIDGLVYKYVNVMPSSTISTAALAATNPAATTTSTANASMMNQLATNYNDAIANGDSASASYWLSLINSTASTAASNPTLAWIEANPLTVAGVALAAALAWRMLS